MKINIDTLLKLSKQADCYAWTMACDYYYGVSEVPNRQMHEWEIEKFSELIIEEYLKLSGEMAKIQ